MNTTRSLPTTLLAFITSVTASASILIGDLNQDNAIGFEDLHILAANWLAPGDCTETGLVAHWKLDESIETIAADTSACGRNGIVFGEPLWCPASGRIGGALEFDGFEDYIEIPNFKGLTGNSPRTCTAWIRTTQPYGAIIGWGKPYSPGARWLVMLDSEGFLRVEIGGGFAIGTTPLADNNWHHIAVVSDGTTTDKIRLYVDGRRELDVTFASRAIATAADHDVKIGIFADLSCYFTGLLDDVRLYERPLSDGEVWALAAKNSTDPACPDMDFSEGVDIGDFALLADNWNRQVPPLLINEFMADNEAILSTRVNGQLEYPDWIELYNPSLKPLDLTGWYLTDDPDDLTKWPFPAGLTIQPVEYLVVFASDKTQAEYPQNYPFRDDDGAWHTNFKLSSSGEYLALVAGDQLEIIHAYDTVDLGGGEFGFPPQRENISYGLQYDQQVYFTNPTPGAANVAGFLGYAEKPQFSHKAGFYTAPFTLRITSPAPDAVIRYTTDGSEPADAASGMLYTAPLRVAATVCIRAKAFVPGLQPSRTATASYLFNVSDTIRSLPVISIVGDEKKSLFEPDGIMAIVGGYYDGSGVWTSSGPGSYNNPIQRGIAYERPVSVEFLNAAGGENIQIDCGIRVAGSDWHRPRYTRGENWFKNFDKFSFKLFFRDSYGESRLYHNIFPLFPVDSFKAVMLRGGHNDDRNPFIKDEWIRRLHKDMGRVAAGGTLMNLFINGKYKAYYNPTERLDHDFFRTAYNSDADWDVITQRDVRNGDSVDFNNMRNFVRNNSMAVDANYRRAADWIDIDDFIDYLIIQLYCCNWDWPQNNWTAARERSPGAKWRFYLWDVEGSLESNSLTYVRLPELNSGGDPSSQLYRSLKASPDFRQAFADRIQQHFFADGALTENNLQMRWHQLRREMAQVLPGMNQYVSTTWIPNRRSVMLEAFTNEGLFGQQGPAFYIDGRPLRGGYARHGARLTMTIPFGSGTIWYTTDGVDPRRPVVPDQTTTVIVPENAVKRVFVPTADIGTAWTGGSEPYNDAAWTHGTPAVPRPLAGVGYERGSGYQDRISYDIGSRLYGNATRSALIRIPFEVKAQDLAQWNLLILRMRYDDGFAAYINGKLVHQQNITGTPGSGASVTSHDDMGQESFDISTHIGALKPGTNILAIHGMNVSANSSDFLILPELLAGTSTLGGGAIAESAVAYTGPVTLEKSIRITARILNNSKWSALTDAVYVVGPVHNLRISELMFHPADANENAQHAEYIELCNAGSEPINLSLVKFADGVDYEFEDVSLAPGGRTLVVNDRSLFDQTYPDFTGAVAGQYVGALNNAGEKVRLVDALGRTITACTYADNWFEITDGEGFSITLRDTAANLSDGIVAHYKMDEPFGTNVSDCSANARNALIRGMPAWLPFSGRTDGALQCAGADYVEVTDYKGVLGSASRTCAAWIKTDLFARQVIFGWGQLGVVGGRWTVVLDEAGRLRTEAYGGYVLGTQTLADGKWHHIAVTMAGPMTDDIRLYVDGRPETISDFKSLLVNTASGSDVGIGSNIDMPNYFKGLLDNVLIYDRALTADEVALLGASADHWEGKQYWRPSAHMGGSPGQDDTGTVPELGAVVINEILAHSHGSDPDWIELYNTTDEPIDISGWFLSDDNDNYMKFRIAPGTVIEPHGYVVFYENQHFNNAQNPGCLKPFALSENGETLYIRSGLDANNNLTGYYEEESFDASETGVAFGRYRKSTGTHNFVAMSYNTPGAPNAYPKVGPIVISEIMYNPPGDAEYEGSDYEFVELCNISDAPVTLQEYDPIRHVMLTWKFTDAIEYTFPLNTTIPPGGFVIVAKNPQAFTARYGPVANVFGPYGGKLANEGEKLEISMPGDIDAQGTRCYIRVDRVNYSDSAEWPQTADGEGDSLTRINLTHYGNDPANWHAAPPTPGQ
ncbi:MAG TPA: lamin tail domain-containing protein [Anaerohalosphaeraceae bacterium]|nr:lamin tail domain-containing protein [Anaerohalosphaeraceae bacterium]